jgi:hypothetical protein
MTYIALIAVACILILQWSIGEPLTGVGGSMVIGLALLAAAPAVGIHEAWTKRRGVLGWIVSIIVALVGALVFAPVGGMVIAMVLSPFMDGARSLAAAGGPVMSVALAGMMLCVLAGAWGALWIVNRWR